MATRASTSRSVQQSFAVDQAADYWKDIFWYASEANASSPSVQESFISDPTGGGHRGKRSADVASPQDSNASNLPKLTVGNICVP